MPNLPSSHTKSVKFIVSIDYEAFWGVGFQAAATGFAERRDLDADRTEAVGGGFWQPWQCFAHVQASEISYKSALLVLRLPVSPETAFCPCGNHAKKGNLAGATPPSIGSTASAFSLTFSSQVAETSLRCRTGATRSNLSSGRAQLRAGLHGGD